MTEREKPFEVVDPNPWYIRAVCVALIVWACVTIVINVVSMYQAFIGQANQQIQQAQQQAQQAQMRASQAEQQLKAEKEKAAKGAPEEKK